MRSDRQKFQPYGLAGGEPGAFASNFIVPSGSTTAERLPGKFMRTLRRGERYSAVLAGGGGWGEPAQREPTQVLEDVLDGKVSREAARQSYGVVIDADGIIDHAATTSRREQMKREATGANAP